MAINSKTVLCNEFTMTYYKSLHSTRLYIHTINPESRTATEIYLDRSDVIALHDYLMEMLGYVKEDANKNKDTFQAAPF
jgi:hypothetical protein